MTYHKFRQFETTEHGLESLKLWINNGIHPGAFLEAVICNDLKRAVMAADDFNIANIPAYVEYLYNHAPAPCWGSVENYKNWNGITN